MKRIITFSPDGTVDFTRSPALLALFPGERKEIVRMTDIKHDPDSDLYYIEFLTGPFKGCGLDMEVMSLIADRIEFPAPRLDIVCDDMFSIGSWVNIYGFPSYEKAVAFEIQVVDQIRQLLPEADFTK